MSSLVGVRRPHVWVCVLVAALWPAPARAQAQPVAGRFDISGGAGTVGDIPFAGVASTQTMRGGERTLFQTESSLERSVGPLATVGVRFARAFRAEFAFGYMDGSLVTRITRDQEGAADTDARTRVRQFLFAGGVVVEVRRWQVGPLVPFASGGSGVLRQIYDGRTLIETGHASYVGGGALVERRSTRRGLVKAAGVRVDVRAMRMRDGVITDGVSHWAPGVAAQLFARF